MNESTRFSPRSDDCCQACQEWTERIIAFYSGEPHDREALIEHLAECSGCRETVGILYRGLKRHGEELRREPEHKSDDAAAETKPAEILKSQTAFGG